MAVAKQAGVGVGSVSRVLSGKGPVSSKMLQRVREAADSLGYQPNLIAQGLRSRSTKTIGFVISDITNSLLASMVSGAEAVLSEVGYSMLLTNSGGRPEIDAQRIQLLLRRQVDGIIVLPATENDPHTVDVLNSANVPVVAIDRELPKVPDASYVISDHSTGLGAATSYLIAAGHRRIGILVGPDMRPARERLHAFLQAHAAASLEAFMSEFGALTPSRARASIARLLDAPDRPSAVILGGNQLLEGAIEVMQIRNLRVGHDMLFVCCDEIPLGRLHQPPIPTVMRDTAGMGRAAALALLARINGEPPKVVTLPTWFDVRSDRQGNAGFGSPD